MGAEWKTHLQLPVPVLSIATTHQSAQFGAGSPTPPLVTPWRCLGGGGGTSLGSDCFLSWTVSICWADLSAALVFPVPSTYFPVATFCIPVCPLVLFRAC